MSQNAKNKIYDERKSCCASSETDTKEDLVQTKRKTRRSGDKESTSVNLEKGNIGIAEKKIENCESNNDAIETSEKPDEANVVLKEICTEQNMQRNGSVRKSRKKSRSSG